MTDDTLAGRAILVVEDEYFIAMDLKEELARAGATVLGPAPTLAKATSLVECAARLDGAILDLNLGGEMVFPLADRLHQEGVPFLFATGYDPSVIPSRFADVPRLEKPIGFDKVRQCLDALLAGEASRREGIR